MAEAEFSHEIEDGNGKPGSKQWLLAKDHPCESPNHGQDDGEACHIIKAIVRGSNYNE